MFSYLSAEKRVPKDHPLRAIRAMVDMALRNMGPQFEAMYATMGRPSIAPEEVDQSAVLQVLYSVRSERQLVEQLDYNLLFRWFVGMNDRRSDVGLTVFTKNRERLLDADVGRLCLQRYSRNAQAGVGLERALYGGRHTDCGVGRRRSVDAQGRL